MTVYIDSSVFLAIFNGEKRGPEILELLRELKREKTKIVTSIITAKIIAQYAAERGMAFAPDPVTVLMEAGLLTRENRSGGSHLEDWRCCHCHRFNSIKSRAWGVRQPPFAWQNATATLDRRHSEPQLKQSPPQHSPPRPPPPRTQKSPQGPLPIPLT